MNKTTEIFLTKREVSRKLLRDIDQAVEAGRDPRTDENVLYWLDVMRHQPKHDPEWLKVNVLEYIGTNYPEEAMLEREWNWRQK